MVTFKTYAAIISSIMIIGLCVADLAIAGEKVKAHGASTIVKWEQIEVGDVEGHVIAISESKQIYINELTGEKSTSVSIGLNDFNLKTGIGSGHGYGITTLKDGDKRIRRWEGESVEKGHMKGTWSYIMGTGKSEGIKGSGTWESFSLGSGQAYVEAEGEIEMPSQ